jgi:magnesium transporter
MTAEDTHVHHSHLEQARSQVIDLLSRQALERELVSRSGSRNQDVIAQLVERQQKAVLEARLAQFHPADVAFVLESLPPEARASAWPLIRPGRRGAVLLEASDAVRRAIIAGLSSTEVAAVVKPLDPDDIADLIGDLAEDTRQAVLDSLDQVDRDEVRSVLSFPEGTVGAAMDLDYIAVRNDASLEAVLRLLRRRRGLPAHTNLLFVVDRENRLLGLLHVERLLFEDPERRVDDVMTDQVHYLRTDDDIRSAIAAFEKYDLISAPVVNLHGRVVGRLTVDAVVDEINARAQSDSLRQVGLSEADQDLFEPVLASARRRWPWVTINLVTAFVASRVIDAFDEIITVLVALAALMPIVASIGGNTGNQSVALVIRGLALNQLGPQQVRRFLRREVAINLVNGTLWGIVLGLLTLLLYQNTALSAVIAVSLLLTMVSAALIGVLTPVLLERFGRDPAMGSSIILTATTDSLGFFIFLGLASVVLH